MQVKETKVAYATCNGCWKMGPLGLHCPECDNGIFKITGVEMPDKRKGMEMTAWIHPYRLAAFMHEEQMVYTEGEDYMIKKHDWLVYEKERINQKCGRNQAQLIKLVEVFQEMMMNDQWTRLSHLTEFDNAHPLTERHVKSEHLLAWHHASKMKWEGKVPACPHAVHFGNDKRTPKLESDEHGQVIKPAPHDPPGAVTLAGKRKR